MFLFGVSDSKTPKEKVRAWTSAMRTEKSRLDRQIHAIKREEEKVKKSLKDAAKRGDPAVCKVLAKEIVSARKSINRINAAKAQLNSVQMSLNHQLAISQVSGSLEKSTEIMKSMQSLAKVSEVSKIMQELSKEMMKAGIIEEMLEETIEFTLGDGDDLEEEVEKEVDKVLWELTSGQLGTAPAVISESLPTADDQGATSPSVADDTDLADMLEKLEALRS